MFGDALSSRVGWGPALLALMLATAAACGDDDETPAGGDDAEVEAPEDGGGAGADAGEGMDAASSTPADGGDGGDAGASPDELPLLEGADADLAVDAIPAYRPDVSPPSAYVWATAEGFVRGLRIHGSRFVVKLDPEATVRAANAAFERVGVGVAGRALRGAVFVELPGEPTQAELLDAIRDLDADPIAELAVEDIVVEVQEAGDTTTVADLGSKAHPSVWTGRHFGGQGDRAWSATSPPRGNWWLEFVRMPAVWNFNDAIERRASKLGVTPEDLSPPIGVVDQGFQVHPDLPLNNADGVGSDHGNMVAGIIAARHDRHRSGGGVGIDGVHPYASVMDSVLTGSFWENVAAGFVASDEIEQWYKSETDVIASMEEMLDDHATLRIVNISIGYQWRKCLRPWELKEADRPPQCDHPEDNPEVLRHARKLARLVWDAIEGDDVLIVSAAGNASDLIVDPDPSVPPSGPVDAKWVNPLNFLALEGTTDADGNALQADNVLVVENVSWDGQGGRRFWDSSTGGHIAAPGTCITSAVQGGSYAAHSGTSFAAPIVAGFAGYLWSLDPSLSVADLKSLILDYGNASAGESSASAPVPACDDAMRWAAVPNQPARPFVLDAFATVMHVDNALQMLVDADDGTPDGATVQGPYAGTALPGDGQVDMADFRAFRDAVLQLREVDLDQPLHAKRDNNGDGCVHESGNTGCPTKEEVWSRFDFNGDGKLSESDASPVWLPGDTAPESRTDLEVLQAAWPGDDCANEENPLTEGYCAADLPGLLESRDVIVDFSAFQPADDEAVRVDLVMGASYGKGRRYQGGDPVIVFTLPHDAACATLPATDEDCQQYAISVVADDGARVRGGGVNLLNDAAPSFYNLPFGSDLYYVATPQMGLTLDPRQATVGTTVMTATASYTDTDILTNLLGQRRDSLLVTYPGCSYPCVTTQDYTQDATELVHVFVPSSTGPHTATLSLLQPGCETFDECNPPPQVPDLTVDFQVHPGAPPPPDPDPDPQPDPDPDPIPDPPALPDPAAWNIFETVQETMEIVCDTSTGQFTMSWSGTRRKRWFTRSHPERTESFSESGAGSSSTCSFGGITGGRARLRYEQYGWFYSQVTMAQQAGDIVTTRSVKNGHRATCSGTTQEECFLTYWESGRRQDGMAYGYFTFDYPPRAYPEYPPDPS